MSAGKKEGGFAPVVVVLMSLGITAVLTTMLINSNTDHLIAANERDAERAPEASKSASTTLTPSTRTACSLPRPPAPRSTPSRAPWPRS
jgi:hypothetical protein